MERQAQEEELVCQGGSSADGMRLSRPSMVDTVKSDWHKVALQGPSRGYKSDGDVMVVTSAQRRAQGCLRDCRRSENISLDPLGRQPCQDLDLRT